jgi:hypothetical protein
VRSDGGRHSLEPRSSDTIPRYLSRQAVLWFEINHRILPHFVGWLTASLQAARMARASKRNRDRSHKRPTTNDLEAGREDET